MDRLRPLQRDFLQAFFAVPGPPESFFLVGGTALAGFHLGHRHSDDLDIFCDSPEKLAPASRIVVSCLEDLGMEIASRRSLPNLVEFTLRRAGEGSGLARIDLGIEPGPLFDRLETFRGIRVMSALDIAVAKLVALGRSDLKDFIDLYAIATETKIDLLGVPPLARQRDPGLEEFLLAYYLRQVGTLEPQFAPFREGYLLRPWRFGEIASFFERLVPRLDAKYPPPRP